MHKPRLCLVRSILQPLPSQLHRTRIGSLCEPQMLVQFHQRYLLKCTITIFILSSPDVPTLTSSPPPLVPHTDALPWMPPTTPPIVPTPQSPNVIPLLRHFVPPPPTSHHKMETQFVPSTQPPKFALKLTNAPNSPPLNASPMLDLDARSTEPSAKTSTAKLLASYLNYYNKKADCNATKFCVTQSQNISGNVTETCVTNNCGGLDDAACLSAAGACAWNGQTCHGCQTSAAITSVSVFLVAVLAAIVFWFILVLSCYMWKCFNNSFGWTRRSLERSVWGLLSSFVVVLEWWSHTYSIEVSILSTPKINWLSLKRLVVGWAFYCRILSCKHLTNY